MLFSVFNACFYVLYTSIDSVVVCLFSNSEEFLVFEYIANYLTDTVVCSEELLTHQTTGGSKLLSLSERGSLH